MDTRFISLLRSLLLNLEVLNAEMSRMHRCGLVTATEESRTVLREIEKEYQDGEKLLEAIRRSAGMPGGT